MMGWHTSAMGPLGWIGMGAFWLILIGLLVWLIVWLLPGAGDGTTSHAAGEPALDILDRRLASGEIDLGSWQAQRAALTAARRNDT